MQDIFENRWYTVCLDFIFTAITNSSLDCIDYVLYITQIQIVCIILITAEKTV